MWHPQHKLVPLCGTKNCNMREDFLHHVWKFQLFNFYDLKTTEGHEVRTISPGIHNLDAGPDFLNARIEIDGIQWIGNVEIHVNKSDWLKHGHQNDDAYNNLILHLVYNDDYAEIEQLKNSHTISLKDRINEDIYQRYLKFLNSNLWIPCANFIYGIDRLNLEMWIDRMMVEKLELKSESILKSLEKNTFNWEQSFYKFLASNFGFKVNGLAFEMLADSLPFINILKHKSNILQIEAMLYGQAGMLNDDFEDEYPNLLKREYKFLQNKFQLKPINETAWNWARLRPQNFPTIRISQFATLIYNNNSLFSELIFAKSLDEIRKVLNISTSKYWENHYQFDKESKFRSKKLGKQSIDLLTINTILPFKFLYGKIHNNKELTNNALQILEALPSEKNHIIKGFESLGVVSNSAFRSQALIHLKKFYCDKKRCLQCGIGNRLLKE